MGYGIVAGLNGTGDKTKTILKQISSDRYQSFDEAFLATVMQSDNVAAVMVTADIPPNYKPGMRVDLTVTSLGDTQSLQGGILLQTLLLGSNQEVYAIAQGATSLKESTSKGPITANIFGGAIVEREIIGILAPNSSVKLLLRSPKCISPERLVSTMNKKYPDTAQVLDLMSIRVKIPPDLNTAEFLRHPHKSPPGNSVF